MRLLVVSLVFLLFLPLAAQDKLLTLEEALDAAFKVNPSMRTMVQQKAVYEYKANENRAGFMPTVNADLSYKRTTLNSAIPPTSGTTSGTTGNPAAAGTVTKEDSDSYNNYSTSVSVSQLIWDFGKVLDNWESQKRYIAAAEYDIETTKQNIYYSVIQSYFAALAAQEQLATIREAKKQMDKRLELAREQLKNGIRTQIDVLRAESDAAQAGLNIVKAENIFMTAKKNLMYNIGSFDFPDFTVETAIISSPDKATAEEIVTTAVASRSDAKSLKEKVIAMEKTASAVKADYFPVFRATAGFSYGGYGFDDIDQNMKYNWYVGASMSWNIFNGLYTTNLISEVKANTENLKISLQSFENSVRLEAENALNALKEAKAKFAPTEALVRSVEAQLKLAMERYSAGAGSTVEVVDAETLYVQAKNSLTQAKYDLEMAKARVNRVMGTLNYGKER